jgi:hypothetical protein
MRLKTNENTDFARRICMKKMYFGHLACRLCGTRQTANMLCNGLKQRVNQSEERDLARSMLDKSQAIN